MKPHILTKGIVLSRRDFGEADRIVTVLTADHGKLNFIAKGVRRPKSKLAGGIELFSVSDMTILPGKSELGTLISSRLDIHYADIAKDIQRTMLGYEILKQLNKLVEDGADAEYFELLDTTLASLNDISIHSDLVELWFNSHLLTISGHALNLSSDATGSPLAADGSYGFDSETMAFVPQKNGAYSANQIKLLRLATASAVPDVLARVQDGQQEAKNLVVLLKNSVQRHTRS